MSKATIDAIEDAIRAHIAEETEDHEILTDWLVIASTFMPTNEDANGYYRAHPVTQAIHTTLGLMECARHELLGNAVASMVEGEDG